MTLTGRRGKGTDVATLVLPPKQFAGRPADIGLAITDAFLVKFTVEEYSDVVATVDAPDGDLVLTLPGNHSLDLDVLDVSLLHDWLLVTVHVL